MAKTPCKIQDPYHHVSVVTAVQTFNTFENFVDICFVCAAGVKVFAHKLLVCSLSNQIKMMLLDLPSCLRHDMVTIHVPDIDSGILRIVFDFLYDGSIKVTEDQYPLVQEVMNTLGIVLTNNTEEQEPIRTPAPEPTPPPQPSPQVVYIPTSHSQGQMQYVMATQTGQIVQNPMLTPVIQASVASQHSAQPVYFTQAGTQMMTPVVQGGAAQQHTPMIIDQASGQIIQSRSQVMTTQVQQSNLLPNNQMTNQIVTASQGSVLTPQPLIMNNSQLQVSMQNQVTASNYVVNQPAQQPQTSNRHYNQAAQPQPSNPNHMNNTSARAGLSAENILEALGEAGDTTSLTAEIIQHTLETKLGMQCSASDRQKIKEVFNSVIFSHHSHLAPVPPTRIERTRRGRKAKLQQKNLPFSKSDDEYDSDFDPKRGSKHSRNANKKRRRE